MGYSTNFQGSFELDKPLTVAHKAYLEAFAQSRRMKRDAEIAEKFPDPVRIAADLPIGPDGAYYVGSAKNNMGQVMDESVIDFNDSGIQPSLWCQWVPTEDGLGIEWDQGEKFYNYVEWLQFLINHFFSPLGYTLNGEVKFQGDDMDDRGIIKVKNSIAKIKYLK